MLNIVSIDELKKGDIILIEGWNDKTLMVLTVKKVTEHDNILFEEIELDYFPEDDQIVKIGTKKDGYPRIQTFN